ncbi:MAG: cysteine desulfurase [Verrucomicrobiales bacterium]|nr:cysteine desulfurase [Verrucomicrobiales bacterium]
MNGPPRIYFDYNATTPLDPGVRERLVASLDTAAGLWANPSSIHFLGRAARHALDDAREVTASVLQCKPGELVFTSGGTEANNLAVFGAARCRRDQGRHLVCSPIEHPAVLQCFQRLAQHEGFTLTLLPVDCSGVIDPEAVQAALRPDTVLVSVMAANNETGAIQPYRDIGRLCRQAGVLFHTDAVQWFGKEGFKGIADFEADLVTLCSHKFHGPRGAGLLYIRAPLPLEPVVLGGSHEHDRRAGTENLPAILGLTDSVARFVPQPVFPRPLLLELRTRLEQGLASMPGLRLRSIATERLLNTVAFTVDGADSVSLLANLDLAGVCASSGSACASGSIEPSHVLRAMGVSPQEASSLVRFSLGRDSTRLEVDHVMALLPEILAQARSCSP